MSFPDNNKSARFSFPNKSPLEANPQTPTSTLSQSARDRLAGITNREPSQQRHFRMRERKNIPFSFPARVKVIARSAKIPAINPSEENRRSRFDLSYILKKTHFLLCSVGSLTSFCMRTLTMSPGVPTKPPTAPLPAAMDRRARKEIFSPLGDTRCLDTCEEERMVVGQWFGVCAPVLLIPVFFLSLWCIH